MGGYGRRGRPPPKLFLFYFYYTNFGGWPPIYIYILVYIIYVHNVFSVDRMCSL